MKANQRGVGIYIMMFDIHAEGERNGREEINQKVNREKKRKNEECVECRTNARIHDESARTKDERDKEVVHTWDS